MQCSSNGRNAAQLSRAHTRAPAGAQARRTRRVVARAFSDVEDPEPDVESRAEAAPPPKPRTKSIRLPDLSIQGVLTSILPDVEGDAKDWFWMIASIAVFTYFAACLFMLYMHLYYSAGFVTIADCLSR